MNRVLSSVLCSTVLLVGAASQAQAAIIFEASPSFVQPDENLLFNGDGLFTGPGLTVQGQTNQTNTVFNLTGLVDLVAAAQGQARIEDEAGLGFDSLSVDALNATTFFTEFEANLNAAANGTAFITATDALGMTYNFDYAINAGGQNFFGLRATDGSLIDTVLITTDASLQDVRQIRIGGITTDGGSEPDPDPDPVPEPTSLVLLGSALLGLGVASRRRR